MTPIEVIMSAALGMVLGYVASFVSIWVITAVLMRPYKPKHTQRPQELDPSLVALIRSRNHESIHQTIAECDCDDPQRCIALGFCSAETTRKLQ
jgi:hypothetical protein